MNPINLQDKKFGRLTILNYIKSSKGMGHAYWRAQCSCGQIVIVRGSHIKSGDIKSCGCLAADKGRKFLKKYANSYAHKGKGNPSWRGNKAKYMAIHNWLALHFKKTKCEKCCSTKNLDWALKKNRKYIHNRNNFIVLCRSHHLKYDYTKERKDMVVKKVLSKRWKRLI